MRSLTRSSPCYSGTEGRPTSKRLIRRLSWIALTIATIALSLIAVAGCATEQVHHIARATRLPDEARGFLRVVQDAPVVVGIVGEDAVSERSIAGYIVIHEGDLAQLVRNTEELLELRAETRRSR